MRDGDIRVSHMVFWIESTWKGVVSKDRSGVKSLRPVRWRHVSLKEESLNDVIDSTKCTFGFPILLRCIGAREM